jgi:hypothetical protein
LASLALKDVDIQSKVKADQLSERIQEARDQAREVALVIEMLQIRVEGASKQKFVKHYLAMMKEAEAALERRVRAVEDSFEKGVVDMRIKAPFFNYVLSQQ